MSSSPNCLGIGPGVWWALGPCQPSFFFSCCALAHVWGKNEDSFKSGSVSAEFRNTPWEAVAGRCGWFGCRVGLGCNCAPAFQDLPSFTQNVHRLVNDLRYYRLCNDSLPPGTVKL